MRYLYGLLLIIFCSITFAQDTFKRPNIPGDIMIDVGLNYWDSESDSIRQKAWPSKSISFYYMRTKFLGRKFTFRYGGGFGFEKLSLGDRHTFFSLEDTVVIDDLLPNIPRDVRKNKLAVTYLDLVVEQRFYPMGTEEGEGFFIGIGGLAGLRVDSHIKWKYETVNEVIVEKQSGRFDLNSLRYGIHARIGFKGVHLFYKQYFSNTFRNNAQQPDGTQDFNPRMTTIGINVTGF